MNGPYLGCIYFSFKAKVQSNDALNAHIKSFFSAESFNNFESNTNIVFALSN